MFYLECLINNATILTKVAEVPTPLSVKIMQLFLNNYVLAQIHIYIHPPIVLIIMWETCITCSGNVVREMCSLLLMGATSISGFIIINEKASKPELMILLVVIITTKFNNICYSPLWQPIRYENFYFTQVCNPHQ